MKPSAKDSNAHSKWQAVMVSNTTGKDDIQLDGPTEGEPEYDESPSCNFCTFAVTGNQPTWQAIYICHECVNDNENSEAPLCICQACADHCHADDDHEVEYIGMGPSYCDCDCIGNCEIFPNSLKEAERLGMMESRDAQKISTTTTASEKSSPKDPLEYAAYEIPILSDPEMSSLLVQHAQELVQHTKETHWIDQKTNVNELCPLESLAWRIYQHHVIKYKLPTEQNNKGGAEWWVQVKDTSGSATAIDLHYDKDEALAESFSIGSFPILSTVTYLTASSPKAAPTVVFDHTYAQGEEDVMNLMLVSRPRLGKHLVFNGSLLHGAPAHSMLKPTHEADSPNNQETPASVRVTFLVNVWKDRRPASVHPLAPKIRQTLQELSAQLPVAINETFEMLPQSVPSIEYEKEQDIPESIRNRIELPFVTKGITWEDTIKEGDDEGGLVVITFPPPPTNDNTFLIRFGPSLQAYLDYTGGEAVKAAPNHPEEQPPQEVESGYV